MLTKHINMNKIQRLPFIGSWFMRKTCKHRDEGSFRGIKSTYLLDQDRGGSDICRIGWGVNGRHSREEKNPRRARVKREQEAI